MSENNDNGLPGKTAQTDGQWQQELITRLAFASLNEQRRARRWNIFFRSLLVGYLLLVTLLIYLPGEPGVTTGTGKHTALIDIQGAIADDTEARADFIIGSLRAAFGNSQTAGVIVRINSPGGSPVQAGYINDEIRRLRAEHPDIPVYAVVTDMCASGGYYIAAAAGEIYADKASIIGSIGVVSNGFGFTGAMDKLGVERRLLTAGESKGFLDPFSPLRVEDVKHWRSVLESVHQQFIDVVKQGRGERLKNDERLFSGLVWTGEQSLELGLIDGLGSSSYVAREIIGAERIVDFTRRPDFLNRFVERLGVATAGTLARVMGIQTPALQ